MTSFKLVVGSLVLTSALVAPTRASAQDMPDECRSVLTTLGKTGDFKDGVLKVNIPRSDLKVTIDKRPAPTPFGFGGWIALTKGQGMDVMMGDLVLTEDEVNLVMSALLENGLQITALHNHFFWEPPRVFYMHVHGMLARRARPAIDLIGQAAKSAQSQATSAPSGSAGSLDSTALAKIIWHQGEQTGPDRSTRSRLVGPTSICASMAPRSTRAWV